MRHLPIALCLLATACAPQQWSPGAEGNMIVPDLAYPGNSGGPAAPAQTGFEDPPIYPAKEALFHLPEGTLPTACSAGAAYPDGKVQPGFYAYPSPPQNDRYMDCLLAEARRDGGTVRVASPSSFPKVGACYFARITDLWPTPQARHEGPSYANFDNRLSTWSYGYVPQLARSRVGDRVRACVQELPEECPSHDLRGIGYRFHNLRTGERWSMYDSQHECRGA